MIQNIFKTFIVIILTLQYKLLYAVENDAGILGGGTSANGDYERCLSAQDLRKGNVHLEDIPCVVKGMIDIFMGFAATIAVIFIIIGAYQVLYGSLEGNKTKGKETIMMALGGFALAAFSWIIIRFILDNFS